MKTIDQAMNPVAFQMYMHSCAETWKRWGCKGPSFSHDCLTPRFLGGQPNATSDLKSVKSASSFGHAGPVNGCDSEISIWCHGELRAKVKAVLLT